MPRIQFNTDRPYTEEGQIIAVDYDLTTGVVMFEDTSRMIGGKITFFDVDREIINGYFNNSERAPMLAAVWLAKLTMHYYDLGNYAPIPTRLALDADAPILNVNLYLNVSL